MMYRLFIQEEKLQSIKTDSTESNYELLLVINNIAYATQLYNELKIMLSKFTNDIATDLNKDEHLSAIQLFLPVDSWRPDVSKNNYFTNSKYGLTLELSENSLAIERTMQERLISLKLQNHRK